MNLFKLKSPGYIREILNKFQTLFRMNDTFKLRVFLGFNPDKVDSVFKITGIDIDAMCSCSDILPGFHRPYHLPECVEYADGNSTIPIYRIINC